MSDYTIVEKYQQTKQQSSIAIRPYFNPNKAFVVFGSAIALP